MADPAPVAQTFFVDETIKEAYKLDGIVAHRDHPCHPIKHHIMALSPYKNTT